MESGLITPLALIGTGAAKVVTSVAQRQRERVQAGAELHRLGPQAACLSKKLRGSSKPCKRSGPR